MPSNLSQDKIDTFFPILKDKIKFQQTCSQALATEPEDKNGFLKIRRGREYEKDTTTNLDTVSSSFIKKDGKLYALSRKILGEGKFGKVKLLIEILSQTDGSFLSGGISVVKIENRNSEMQQFEHSIASKLNMTIGSKHERISSKVVPKMGKFRHKKYYSHLVFLGNSLEAHLNEKADSITLNQRLDIAIQLGEEIDKFNEMGYIHHDIKLANATIDADGKVHLIDFGFSRARSEGIAIQGTPMKMLGVENYKLNEHPISHYLNEQKGKLNGGEIDALALKRTFYPFHCPYEKDKGIFSTEEVTSFSPTLQDMLNTNTTDQCVRRKRDSALLLATELILERYFSTAEDNSFKNEISSLMGFSNRHELISLIQFHKDSKLNEQEKTQLLRIHLEKMLPELKNNNLSLAPQQIPGPTQMDENLSKNPSSFSPYSFWQEGQPQGSIPTGQELNHQPPSFLLETAPPTLVKHGPKSL